MPAQARNLHATLGSLGLAWKVLSSRELPGGWLVWLGVTPYARDLADAGAARELVIGETGVVSRLKVRNPGNHGVLLPSDLVVDGGKQARVVERSVIIPASAEVEIPVRCVEEGRWHPRDSQSAQHFQVSASVSTDSRRHFTQLKRSSLRRRKRYDLDQSEVWTHVASTLEREDLTSPTSSYTAVLVKRERRMEEARALDVRAPEGANGVAVIRRLGASWVEAFSSQGHVDAAVAAFAADLLDEPPAPEATASSAPPVSRASSALRLTWAAQVIPVETPPGTSGQSFAIDADGVAGFALVTDERLAHLVVSVAF